jgi:hypothetical protein
LFLYLFITKASSYLHYSFSFSLVKSLESGFLNTSLNKKLPTLLSVVSLKFLSLTAHSPLQISLLLSALITVFYFV